MLASSQVQSVGQITSCGCDASYRLIMAGYCVLAGDRVSQRHAAAAGVQCRHRGQPHRRHRPPLAFHEVSWLPAAAAAPLIDPPLPSDIWLRQGFQNIYTGLFLLFWGHT